MRILLVLTEINQKFGALGAAHGLMSISACLKQEGYTDIHFGYYPDPNYLEKWQEDLNRIKPQIIGIYTTAPQFQFIQKMIQAVESPDPFIILGGPHPTIYPQCLEKTPRLNALCIGEGEYPMLDLARALGSRKRCPPDPKSLGQGQRHHPPEPLAAFYSGFGRPALRGPGTGGPSESNQQLGAFPDPDHGRPGLPVQLHLLLQSPDPENAARPVCPLPQRRPHHPGDQRTATALPFRRNIV
ncbi:MAG: cobalamin B12-binding domain-containing protein [Desulfobacteraceae bacterium]|nr:MAG: cobalamin B12-binding domain-containing protein [Desulfobacteraceae bacterium]